MLKKRQEKIVQILLTKREGFAGRELAEKVQVTTRTIRNDIIEINSVLSDFDAKIQSQSSKGYSILEKDKNIIKEAVLANTDDTSSLFPTTPSERELYLFFKLLWETESITMDTLAAMIFVSKTTISFDIKRMQGYMKNLTDIELHISPIRGIKINGKESAKRFLLSKVISKYYGSNLHFLKTVFKVFEITKDYDFYKLYDIFVHCFDTNTIVLTDRGLYTLTLETLAFISRYQNGFALEEDYTASNAPLINLPFTEIENLFHVKIDSKERSYFHVCYSFKRILSANTSLISSEIAQIITNEFIENINHDFQINLLKTPDLKNNLALHINTMIQRLNYETDGEQGLINDIKLTYPFAFELAVTIIPIIKKYLDLEMDETELSYIAVHLAVILDSINSKKNVAILCGSGLCTAQLIINRLNNYFNTKVNIVGYFPIYQLNKLLEKYKDLDLILTTLPIKADTTIPILQISPMFNQNDINLLNTFLQRSTYTNSEEPSQLYDDHILNPELFFVFEDDRDTTAILKTMVNKLYQLGYIKSYSLFYSSVVKREKLYSTIYNTIWVPHPMYGMSKSTVMVIGVIKHGKKIDLIFLCAINPKETNQFQGLYSKIVNILSEKEMIDKLITANDFNEFKSVFYSL